MDISHFTPRCNTLRFLSETHKQPGRVSLLTASVWWEGYHSCPCAGSLLQIIITVMSKSPHIQLDSILWKENIKEMQADSFKIWQTSLVLCNAVVFSPGSMKEDSCRELHHTYRDFAIALLQSDVDKRALVN